MKKYIIIGLLAFLMIPVWSQPNKEIHDTLFWTSVSKDTTVFRMFKRDVAYVEIDIATFANNDTITVGYSCDKESLEPVSDLFPMKIAKATYVSHVNGLTRYRIAIAGDNWHSKYIGIRCKYAGNAGTCKPSLHWSR
jgi:hypothetical protein